MKAIMYSVPKNFLEDRQRKGLDRWDEMWNGVLHMPPMPNRAHQEFEWSLETYLRMRWIRAHPNKMKVFHQINVASVGGWPNDFRIPDLVIASEKQLNLIDRNDYFEGAPEVVVEIRSPGDESLEKLPFYAEIGVLEVWIIDRATKKPEIYLLKGKRYKKKAVASSGWLKSDFTGLELRMGKPGKLLIRLAGNDLSRLELP